MSELRRAFVAVVPPPAALAGVESTVDSLGELVPSDESGDGLRWTPRDQWHLTVQFLGRLVELDSLVESLVDSLRRVPAFDVQLGGGGAFPEPAHGSVLWVGVAAGGAELAALAGAVHEATAPLGFATDGRPFRPHLTLARAPMARDLAELVTALGDGPVGPAWTVDEVVLVESTPSTREGRPAGAVHTHVRTFALRGGRGSVPC